MLPRRHKVNPDEPMTGVASGISRQKSLSRWLADWAGRRLGTKMCATLTFGLYLTTGEEKSARVSFASLVFRRLLLDPPHDTEVYLSPIHRKCSSGSNID